MSVALPTSRGYIVSFKGGNVNERDLERGEYHLKYPVRLYNHWEAWEFGSSSKSWRG